MAALEWPEDVCPASLTWRPESNTKTFRSPFNGASQTVRFPGTRWVCSLTFNNLSDEKSRRIDSLVAELDGEYGRVKIRDWGRSGRTPAGSPLVDGANQTGTELHSKGWTAGMVVLRQGDYITVNDELKMVTADVSSASNGTALIPFAPMLRSSPPANAVIEVANPYGIFKLKDNQQGAGNRVPGVFTSYTLEFEEAF
ncbi:hypothetical protein [Citrobacter koseri]|uniref:Phage protein n=1 Tax=Citrobacter koseri TaxID=545 RepID=A0AAW4EKB1_CITKO|nr:hypothetical protein [Citrobacter koseri]OFV11332.1 hypothetical protein HMPREF3126_14600 [Salmonella sp. HMSC13B08]MBJ8714957.1 hypothetical protein [Citrobacter koseri]MBJ8752513.1 hypothetical protein [Citrobacter koseri]MBJ8775742.1 hypothetical protein [Citrobacter koseri]MBJ8859779.1 hypothetical protein [Citrobacter koseri]